MCCRRFIGGPPVTTYSEVTGAISLTKITDPSVIRITAVAGILFSVFGKISALLNNSFASAWWNYAFVIWYYCFGEVSTILSETKRTLAIREI